MPFSWKVLETSMFTSISKSLTEEVRNLKKMTPKNVNVFLTTLYMESHLKHLNFFKNIFWRIMTSPKWHFVTFSTTVFKITSAYTIYLIILTRLRVQNYICFSYHILKRVQIKCPRKRKINSKVSNICGKGPRCASAFKTFEVLNVTTLHIWSTKRNMLKWVCDTSAHNVYNYWYI